MVVAVPVYNTITQVHYYTFHIQKDPIILGELVYLSNCSELCRAQVPFHYLTIEELESAISELYPRYQAKRLAVLRKMYGQGFSYSS